VEQRHCSTEKRVTGETQSRASRNALQGRREAGAKRASHTRGDDRLRAIDPARVDRLVCSVIVSKNRPVYSA
jgi:hypothetical protein